MLRAIEITLEGDVPVVLIRGPVDGRPKRLRLTVTDESQSPLAQALRTVIAEATAYHKAAPDDEPEPRPERMRAERMRGVRVLE